MVLYKIVIKCDACQNKFDIYETEVLEMAQDPPSDIICDIKRYRVNKYDLCKQCELELTGR